MPTLIKGLQKKHIHLEGGNENESKELVIYRAVDERGKEYKVGPGLFMVDFYIIETNHIIAAEPSGPIGRPDGFKLTIQNIPSPIYFRSKDYDISLIQNLIIVSRNLMATDNPNKSE